MEISSSLLKDIYGNKIPFNVSIYVSAYNSSVSANDVTTALLTVSDSTNTSSLTSSSALIDTININSLTVNGTGISVTPSLTSDNNTIATTSYVNSKVNMLLGTNYSDLLNSFSEIDAALNNDPDFYNTITTMISQRGGLQLNNTWTGINTFNNVNVNGYINDCSANKISYLKNVDHDISDSLIQKVNNSSFNEYKGVVDGLINNISDTITTYKTNTDISLNSLANTKYNISDFNTFKSNNDISLNNIITNIDNHTQMLNNKLDSSTYNTYITNNDTNILTINNSLSSLVTSLLNYYNKTEIDNKFNELINSAPSMLDTLGEIASYLSNTTTDINGILLSLSSKASIIDVSNNYTKLSDMGNYVLTSSLSNYVTSSTLSSYVTSTSLTSTLSNYLTQSSLLHYITDTSLNNTLANYLTSSSLTNMNININSLTENINTLTVSSSALTVSFSSFTNLIYCTPSTSANMTLYLTNVPTTFNKSYTLTFVINSSTYKQYFRTLYINGTAYTIKYLNGSSNISVSSATNIMQQFYIMVFSSGTFNVNSSIVQSY